MSFLLHKGIDLARQRCPLCGVERDEASLDSGPEGLIEDLVRLVDRGGSEVRKVQTGRLRTYVLVMGLTVLILLGMLFAFIR